MSVCVCVHAGSNQISLMEDVKLESGLALLHNGSACYYLRISEPHEGFVQQDTYSVCTNKEWGNNRVPQGSILSPMLFNHLYVTSGRDLEIWNWVLPEC